MKSVVNSNGNKALQQMILESKSAAQKSLATSTLPKNIKELEALSEQRRKGLSAKDTAHAQKTDAMV